ncbi:MAG TPA: response regulator [Ktedonobacterales bacterium]|jgi:CheY-like chemotaxis protein
MVRILVVEDDKDTRDALRYLLEDAGYAMAEAADGLQALDALRASPDSLVALLDLDLPRLDGTGVLREVTRDRRLAARHAFIVMTAVSYSRYQAAEELCAALSIPVIPKPFDVEVLLDAVTLAAQRLPKAPRVPGDGGGRDGGGQ